MKIALVGAEVIELPANRCYMLTLFQPQIGALAGEPLHPPLGEFCGAHAPGGAACGGGSPDTCDFDQPPMNAAGTFRPGT